MRLEYHSYEDWIEDCSRREREALEKFYSNQKPGVSLPVLVYCFVALTVSAVISLSSFSMRTNLLVLIAAVMLCFVAAKFIKRNK